MMNPKTFRLKHGMGLPMISPDSFKLALFMIRTHILGFPRMGAQRELKFALERHWRGEIDAAALEAVGAQLRERPWALQRDAGLDLVTVGDFAFYDQVANHIQLFGCEPARFGFT